MDGFEQIGVHSFRTRDYGFTGTVFLDKEDFLVQEIENDKTVLDVSKKELIQEAGTKKDFLKFTLVKKGLSTQEALYALSRENHLGIKRFGYLGNKDRNAVTSQRISVFKGDASALRRNYVNFFIKDLEYSDTGCKIGALYGNRFTIRIRDFGEKQDLEAFISEANRGLLNFYGPQHFGSSALNIDVSRAIINRDFKRAALVFLFSERNESQAARDARKYLHDNFYGAVSEEPPQIVENADELLQSLPRFLNVEVSMLRRLLFNRHDYIGAFRLIPKYFRLLILQSFQAYIFNLTLSSLNAEGNLPESLPTIGYDLKIDGLDSQVSGALLSTIEKEGLSGLSSFEIKEMPEVSLKTFSRPSIIKPESLSFKEDGDDVIITFDLQKGAYATIFLMEMFRGKETFGIKKT